MAACVSPKTTRSLPDKLSSEDVLELSKSIRELLNDHSGDLDEQVRCATRRFTHQNVAQFGLSLGVPLHQIKNVRRRSSADPHVQAMEVYDFWKKEKGGLLSPEDQRKQLTRALEDAHHGREAVKLRQGGRTRRTKTHHNLSEVEVYQRLLNTEVDKPKIKIFGLALGLESTVIENIMADNSSDGDTVIAHAVFVEWKSTCAENDGPMKETLDQAFNEISWDLTMRRPMSPPPVSPPLVPNIPIRSTYNYKYKEPPLNY